MTKIAALLPMKGNSERVPNKNLKNFCGTPLYHRVMHVLLASDYISHVIVNTDSEAIKSDIEANFGQKVIIHHRPEAICGDLVSMNKVIAHDVENFNAEYYVQTHSTNPMLLTASLDGAIKTMLESKDDFDSIFSVTKIQTRLYDENGKAFNHDPNKLLRTQDLAPLYEENSNFFIFTEDSFKASGEKRIGNNPMMYEIDKLEAIDIDDPQDFQIAEVLYRLLREPVNK